MKDFSEQITSILLSNLRQGLSLSANMNEETGLSKSVTEINKMIQEEVKGLELQVVYLTEELAETDSLLIEAKKMWVPYYSRAKSKSRVAGKVIQAINK